MFKMLHSQHCRAKRILPTLPFLMIAFSRLLCCVLLLLLGQRAPAQSRQYQIFSLDTSSGAQAQLDCIRRISNELFSAFSFTGNNGISIQGRLLSPPDRSGSYPLVVIFHGSGAIGTDGSSHLGVMTKFWVQDRIRNAYPAYVLAVQFPTRSSNYDKDPQRNMLVSHPEPCVETALQLVDSLLRNTPLDRSRIYGLGYSMGASTALNALRLRSNLFAAVVAISGVPEFRDKKLLAKTPLLLVHGNADTENAFAGSQLLFRELRTLKKNKAVFWEIDGAEHNLNSLWLTDKIPTWLFAHKKR